MAAVLGVADDQVVEICASSSTDVDIVQAVNFNSPGQVVIAGSNAALAKAIEALKAGVPSALCRCLSVRHFIVK